MNANRPALLAAVLIGALLFSGCVHLPASRFNRATPAPLPAWATNSLAGSGTLAFKTHEKELEARRGCTIKQVELAVESNPAGSPTVLEYYQLTRGTNPVILLLPVSGGGYQIERFFARYFARHGFAVLIVHRAKIARELNEIATINDWMKQRMVDLRQVIDWVETRPELDAGRIGVFGISMGGIQGTILTAVDERVRAAVLGLAGEDLPYILTHSTEKGIVRRREAYLRERQLPLERVEEELRQTVVWDPKTLAPCIDPQRALLVLGVCDTTVPFKKGWALRKSIGRPETILLPTGHYTALLCIPYIERRGRKFFQARFDTERQDGLPRPTLASPKAKAR
jgi:pimeloyl-ACP methyl ester carboxylesterase